MTTTDTTSTAIETATDTAVDATTGAGTTTELPAIDSGAVPTEAPLVYRPWEVADGVHVIPAYLPVPGMGVLPANSYLVDGEEPLLVDAGPGGAADGFRAALEQLVDPTAIRWLWLTHTDPDHVGALAWLLDAAPQMRVITTYLAGGKLGLHLPVPLDRMHWCNPGDRVDIGSRTFAGLRPPTYDAPETVAAYDTGSQLLFSADCFGALMHQPHADARDLPAGDLAEGLALWSTVDAPWVTTTDRSHFTRALDGIRALAPTTVLSAHLPPAAGMADTLVDLLATVPDRGPWQAPDQAALTALLEQVQ